MEGKKLFCVLTLVVSLLVIERIRWRPEFRSRIALVVLCSFSCSVSSYFPLLDYCYHLPMYLRVYMKENHSPPTLCIHKRRLVDI